MIINKFSILDYKNDLAGQYIFGEYSNIICSSTNGEGKSSIIKSIYYALGYDIATFPNYWNYSDMRFRLDISIGKEKHFVIRQNDIFYVNNFKEGMSKTRYTNWFEEQLKIEMKLNYKTSEKLQNVYASQYLLPFYIDQDKSWGGFLYKGSDKSSSAFKDVPKSIFDYIFGISNNSILELEAEKSEKVSEKNLLINQIELLVKMEDQFINTNGKGTLPNVLENYQNEIDAYLLEINRLNENLSKKKDKYVEIQNKINEFKASKREMEKILNYTEKEYKKIEYVCVQCNSTLTLEQSSKRLRLSNNKFDLIEEISKIKNQTEKYLDKKESIREEIQKFQKEYDYSMSRIKENKQAKNIEEYIEMKKDELLSIEYQKIKNNLHNKVDGLSENITEISNKISRLNKVTKEKKETISERYTEIKSDLQYRLGDDQLHNIDFYSFKQVHGSGMSINKTILALYLTYSKLIQEYSIIDIPLGMDSFIKNEIATKEGEKMFDAMIEYFINLKHQTFFSIISSNYQQYLSNIDLNHCTLININKPLLSKETYFKIKDYFG